MNLKYYLRGLGIGIVVSTLIVGISNGQDKTLSDAEIRQRATELGMVESSGVLADEIPSAESQEEKLPSSTQKEKVGETTTQTEKSTPTKMPESTETPAPTEKPVPTKTPKTTEKPVPTKMPEATEAPMPTEVPEEDPVPTVTPEVKEEEQETVSKQEEVLTGEKVTIVVRSGDGSYTVCKRLEEAGLIESAASYDVYLYENGYDKRIVAATHEIPAGADEEQIAKILTGRK